MKGEDRVSAGVRYACILLCCNLWGTVPSYSSLGLQIMSIGLGAIEMKEAGFIYIIYMDWRF